MAMQIVIANDERESVFAEIYDGDRQWAEVSFHEPTGAMRLRVWGAEGRHVDGCAPSGRVPAE